MATPRNIEVLTTVPFPETVMQRLRSLTPRIKITLNPAKKVEEIPQEIWNRAEVLYTDILLPEPGIGAQSQMGAIPLRRDRFYSRFKPAE